MSLDDITSLVGITRVLLGLSILALVIWLRGLHHSAHRPSAPPLERKPS